MSEEQISELKVMRSNAGYYIGREYFDTEIGAWLPYDRVSGYWAKRETAEKVLPDFQRNYGGGEE